MNIGWIDHWCDCTYLSYLFWTHSYMNVMFLLTALSNDKYLYVIDYLFQWYIKLSFNIFSCSKLKWETRGLFNLNNSLISFMMKDYGLSEQVADWYCYWLCELSRYNFRDLEDLFIVVVCYSCTELQSICLK